MEAGAQEVAGRIIFLHTEKCTSPYFVQNNIQDSVSSNTINKGLDGQGGADKTLD